MFESTWTSSKSQAAKLWKKVRNVIFGVAQFRRAIRRRSLSLCSNSGSEYDKTSIDSFLDDHIPEKSTIMKSEIVNTAPTEDVLGNQHVISSISEESTGMAIVQGVGGIRY